MNKNNTICLSLTGENSHTVGIAAGQGSFAIGTKSFAGVKKIPYIRYDVLVEEGIPINWNAFDGLYTPYGQQNTHKYPYGNWPRVFRYSGDDTGFIEWSRKREIEEFHWYPNSPVSIDLSNANISRVSICAAEKLNITLGDNISFLSLSGNLDNIKIKECTVIPYLFFSPASSIKNTKPYSLPIYKAFEETSLIDIHINPVGTPFDCQSLLQFRNLKNLTLYGNMTNLWALAKLPNLNSLAMRYVPDLTGMPELATWNNLKSFIGWNIEETVGKKLRTELKQLKKEKIMDYSTVSQLHKKIWFINEYGIPFSDWETKKAKAATKAYKNCLKEIKKSQSEHEAHTFITKFLEVINKLPDINKAEQKDINTAVNYLTESASIKIPQKTAQNWFDEIFLIKE